MKQTTEQKIKSTLTRLQKLVKQYYDENPGTTNPMKGDTETLNYYGSAVVGITYNEYIGKWQTVANLDMHATGDNYINICSPANYKVIKL